MHGTQYHNTVLRYLHHTWIDGYGQAQLVSHAAAWTPSNSKALTPSPAASWTPCTPPIAPTPPPLLPHATDTNQYTRTCRHDPYIHPVATQTVRRAGCVPPSTSFALPHPYTNLPIYLHKHTRPPLPSLTHSGA